MISEVWWVLDSYPELAAAKILTLSLIIAWIADHLFGEVFLVWSKRTKTRADDLILKTIRRPVYLSLVLVGLYLSLAKLSLSPTLMGSVDKVLWTLGVVIWGYALVRLFQVFSGILEHKLAHTHGMIDADIVPFLDRLAQVVVIIIGAFILMNLWGLDVTPLLASAGVAGFAVAFAAKDTVGNLFGGISVFLDRPYKVGDYVIVQEDYRGEVIEIGMRSTRIRTRDNVLVTVPNSVMVTDAVINETGFDPKLRIRIPLSVAYDSNLDKVEKMLVNTVGEHKDVLKKPTPRVRYRNFGDSGIELEVLAVIGLPAERGRVVHELMKMMHVDCAKHKVTIPFPQRDVHLVKE